MAVKRVENHGGGVGGVKGLLTGAHALDFTSGRSTSWSVGMGRSGSLAASSKDRIVSTLLQRGSVSAAAASASDIGPPCCKARAQHTHMRNATERGARIPRAPPAVQSSQKEQLTSLKSGCVRAPRYQPRYLVLARGFGFGLAPVPGA